MSNSKVCPNCGKEVKHPSNKAGEVHFGEEKLVFKNGEIKLNDLGILDKITLNIKNTPEEREHFLNSVARNLTAKKATQEFMAYCKKYNLSIKEFELVLHHLKDKHQLLLNNASERLTI